MTRQAERRAHLDLQINLLAEQESTATLRLVQSIARHLGIAPDPCLDEASLSDETDLEQLAARIDQILPEAPGVPLAESGRPEGHRAPEG
jgi:uncharacterized membrane protein